MRFIRNLLAGLLMLVLLAGFAPLRTAWSQSPTAPAPVLDGFTAEASAQERRWEEDFRAVPAPASAREHLRRLTVEPHVAGTKEDYA
ncbi:MAG TPA: hypothetical protein VK208_12525, partial [Pyrinomonadaceae bacterium]|nr:hypothetical protein [Pyrinomonadaceae bacterium]